MFPSIPNACISITKNKMKPIKSNMRQLLMTISKEMLLPRQRTFNIVLEGNIGSGKTTFLNNFQKYKAISIDVEPLDLWLNCHGHNLLALQYEDPVKWSSTLQSYIQLTMLQLHLKQTTKPVRMMERSIFSARHCFIELMIRDQKMPQASALVLDEWYKYITKSIPIHLDLIVYLRTSPEVVYKRMLKRDRVEESRLSFDYIKNLHDLHEAWLTNENNLPAPVLIVDGNTEKHLFEEEFVNFNPNIVKTNLSLSK